MNSSTAAGVSHVRVPAFTLLNLPSLMSLNTIERLIPNCSATISTPSALRTTAGTSLPSDQLISTTSDLVESPRTFATTPTLATKSLSRSLGTVIRSCVQLRKPRIFRFQATCRLLQLTSLTCLYHAIPFPYSLCYRFDACIMLCLSSHVCAH